MTAKLIKWCLFLFFCVLFLPESAQAEHPSIDLQVDRDTITLGEALEVTITIKGGSALTTPDIPSLGNFDVVGKSSANSIEVVNGEMSLTNTFVYFLQARNPGDFPIGPVAAHIDGKSYSAGPIQVKVLPRDRNLPYAPASPAPGAPGQLAVPPGPAPGWPPGPPPQAEGEGQAETFITAQTDKSEAFLGEQVLFTFRLYTSVGIQNAQLSLPDFKDFITEELVKERKFETTIGGVRYVVNEWRLALFPTKEGNLETGKSSVQGMVREGPSAPFNDPFFQRFGDRSQVVSRTFSAPSVPIQVKKLPPAPPGFSGMVGQYNILSHLSQDLLRMGDTTHLEVEISGKGNLGEVNLPPLPDTPFFKTYPGKPTLKLDKTLEGIQGKKTFSYALVAERPGQTEIPGWKLFYFDPTAASYQELSIPPQKVMVQGSAVSEPLVTAGGAAGKTSPLGNQPLLDLQPIKPAAGILDSEALKGWQSLLWLALLFGSPTAFFLYVFLQRMKSRSLLQIDDRKKSRAFRKAKHALGSLDSGGPTEERFQKISTILKEYLSDRFLVKAFAMTPTEVGDFLKNKNIDPQSLHRMVSMLDQLESWKYGGDTETLIHNKELKKEITELLREIEKAA
jgi:hypothetical protein